MRKIYLAGPDVFRPNAEEHFEKMKVLCIKYGFIGVSPFDGEPISDIEIGSSEHSKEIYIKNIKKVVECDIIIANLIPFRGACVDDGTAFEIGCGAVLGKKIYGYTPYYGFTLEDITIEKCNLQDQKQFTEIEDFQGNHVNLMMNEAIRESGGVILKSFEDVLKHLCQK